MRFVESEHSSSRDSRAVPSRGWSTPSRAESRLQMGGVRLQAYIYPARPMTCASAPEVIGLLPQRLESTAIVELECTAEAVLHPCAIEPNSLRQTWIAVTNNKMNEIPTISGQRAENKGSVKSKFVKFELENQLQPKLEYAR